MRREVTLVVELLDDKPGAMLQVLIALNEDLGAMVNAGLIVNYGFRLPGENQWIVKLDDD